MGALFGVFDKNQRESPQRLADRIVTAAGPDAKVYRQPGLVLACRADQMAADREMGRQIFGWPHGSCLAWDGRLDNADAIRQDLNLGVGPNESDAAVALGAYNAEGVRAFRRLIGDWS